MSDNVTVYHRDICTEGFKLTNVADAVFLDIPNPWNAIKSAKDAIKNEGGRLCSFSPCMEQVQKTSIELRNQNFIDIQTFENLRCVYSVKSQIFPEFDFQMNSMNKNSEPTDSTNIKSCKKRKNDNENSDDSEDENGTDVYKPYCSKPINLQPGHTGYLTFATLLNKNFIKNKRAEEEEKMNL
jgi:tRNA (adenine57-N1/adenine58-N1)-methyltransferase